MHIDDLLRQTVEAKASDLHLTVGVPPMIRIWGKLQPTSQPPLTPEDTFQLAYSMLNTFQKQKFEKNWELDLSYSVTGLGRFRVNVYRQRGSVGVASRVIPETISAALTIAETGHLVFATLHTANAAQSIDRIIDVFPPYQQQQIRVQLAAVLEAVISQQLLPNMQFMAGRSERRTVAAAVGVSAARSSSTGGDGKRTRWPALEELGRVPAVEIMMATPAIRNLIREAKTHQIHTSIQTGAQFGMQTMDQSLFALYTRRLITLENALARAIFPDELRKIIERGGQ